MFTISVESTFEAAHCLREYEGKCANLRGHNWKARVTLSAPELDRRGMVVDFLEVKQALDALTGYLDHQHINERPPFTEVNPTAENLARWLHEELGKKLDTPGVTVEAVQVWETEHFVATYRPHPA